MKKKTGRVKTIFEWILLLTLMGSVVFAVIRYINAPDDTLVAEGERLKNDYLLMIVQCIAGVLVMFLPSVLGKKFKFDIPNYMFVLYYFFLYCAIYLGEVGSFYYRIPFWDTMLHGMSACMLGALGFSVVFMFNDSPEVSIKLSPLFVGIFAFCFAVAIGVIWEMYEFTLDSLFEMNMQKYRLETGQQLLGHTALIDTMEDLIVDVAGALLTAVVGSVTLRRRIREASEGNIKGSPADSLIIKKQK